MNAWLITWEGTSLYKKKVEKIVAILSSRKSYKEIAKIVELLYMRAMNTASDMAYYANRRKAMPFKAQKFPIINGILYSEKIFCGDWQLMLLARKVINLTISIDETRGKEVLTWIEPPAYKWEHGQLLEVKSTSEEELKRWERDYPAALCKDIWV